MTGLVPLGRSSIPCCPCEPQRPAQAGVRGPTTQVLNSPAKDIPLVGRSPSVGSSFLLLQFFAFCAFKGFHMKGLGFPPPPPSGIIIWLGIDSRTRYLGALFWQAFQSFSFRGERPDSGWRGRDLVGRGEGVACCRGQRYCGLFDRD